MRRAGLGPSLCRAAAYATPCIVVWTAYLLAFWPGILSKDDTFEWQRVRAGDLGNDVPAAHELLVAVVHRVWDSPAALASLQIVALALAVGFALAELERWRVGRLARGLMAAVFALSWVNGFMVVWAGRDTVFAIATFALAGILLRCIRTGGRWLDASSHLAVASLTLLATALLRHNGPLVAGACALALVIAFPKARRRTLVAAAGSTLAWLLITRLAFPALGVQPMSPRIRLQYFIHHIAAYVADGGALDTPTRATVEAMAPLAVWTRGYDCYTVDPIVWNPEFDAAALGGHADDVVAAWLDAVRGRPRTLLRHQLCAASLVWRITEVRPTRARLFLIPTRFIDPATSRLPRLAAWLNSLRIWTADPHRVWWTWRPALYLYFALALTAAATWRTGEARLWLVLLPGLVNSATWLAVGMAQHFRYQYPVYLIALLTPALLAIPRPERPRPHL